MIISHIFNLKCKQIAISNIWLETTSETWIPINIFLNDRYRVEYYKLLNFNA